tara:strand:- start:1362 stop:3329 length:1968 start_codon:yes stop_codon:yes gene_type:complete
MHSASPIRKKAKSVRAPVCPPLIDDAHPPGRSDTRKGWYGSYVPRDYQQKFIDTLPVDGSSFFIQCSTGFGKTVVASQILKTAFAKAESAGEHAVALVVVANKAMVNDQARQYGSKYTKPYTQGKAANEKNPLFSYLHGNLHPTVLATPQMYARMVGDMNKMHRFVRDIGEDTKRLVVVIDECHDVYSSNGVCKQAVKQAETVRMFFDQHGIRVTTVGMSATLNLTKPQYVDNATRLIGVDVSAIDDEAVVFKALPEVESLHQDYLVQSRTPLVNTRRSKRFADTPLDCGIEDCLLDALSTLIVGRQAMRFCVEFQDVEVLPFCLIDNAIKNLVTHITALMLSDKNHVIKHIGSCVTGGLVYDAHKSAWSPCSLYPNAAIFFQTSHMARVVIADLKSKAADQDEDASRRIVAMTTSNEEMEAERVVTVFDEMRKQTTHAQDVDVDGNKNETDATILPNVLLDVHRDFRRGSNLLGRHVPSTLIVCGNFKDTEMKQMTGRVGRPSNHVDGDVVAESVNIVSIASSWVDNLTSLLKQIREVAGSSVRVKTRVLDAPRYTPEFKTLLSDLISSDTVEPEDMQCCIAVVKILQNCSLLDGAYCGTVNLGSLLCELLMREDKEADQDTFFNLVKEWASASPEDELDDVFDANDATTTDMC